MNYGKLSQAELESSIAERLGMTVEELRAAPPPTLQGTTTTKDLIRVYRTVRHSGHGRWRALRCCRDAKNGAWKARDGGEMKAQLLLLTGADLH